MRYFEIESNVCLTGIDKSCAEVVHGNGFSTEVNSNVDLTFALLVIGFNAFFQFCCWSLNMGKSDHPGCVENNLLANLTPLGHLHLTIHIIKRCAFKYKLLVECLWWIQFLHFLHIYWIIFSWCCNLDEFTNIFNVLVDIGKDFVFSTCLTYRNINHFLLVIEIGNVSYPVIKLMCNFNYFSFCE